MNSSSPWCNPPPPGIDMDEDNKPVMSSHSYAGSVIDQIDPYIKNPEYVKYKRTSNDYQTRRSRSRSYEHPRSKSRERERRRKHRSRSRSRGRHRRSRSRSRNRRHRRYSHSSSRSRSRSTSPDRPRYKHKRKKSRRSRSRSRSHDRRRRERKTYSAELRKAESAVQIEQQEDSKGEEEEVDTKENAFKNDGSFLEMFKKMQEEKSKAEAEQSAAPSASYIESETRKPLPVFGKRRGGRVLKTGVVEKTKVVEDDELAGATDPWSIYLKEVKRYKEACCDDDSKTRPLVK